MDLCRCIYIIDKSLTQSTTLLTYQLEKECKEVGRLSANQTVLIEDITYYRTQNSISVASAHKLSRINSIQAVKTETILAIKTPLINNLDTLTAPCFHYTSRFIEISGCIIQNEFKE